MTNRFSGRYIECSKIIRPRFSEIDAMGIMWHGAHVTYLEDLREEFGAAYNLRYLDMYQQGFMAPVVHMSIDYKASLAYGDEVLITARLLESYAAKIIFEYEIRNASTGTLCATATTVQVFTDLKGTLQLTFPAFYQEWKESVEWQKPDK